MFNSSNQPNTWYDYTPYGTIWRSTQNKEVSYKFTGQERDNEIGLNNFRARMYDDTLNVFYAVDPGHNTSSPYGYVGGNPVSFIDPTGRVTTMAPGQPSWEDIIKHIWEINFDATGGGGPMTFDASYSPADPFGVFQGTGITQDTQGNWIIGNTIIYNDLHYQATKDPATGNWTYSPTLPLGGTIQRGTGGYWETQTLNYFSPGYFENPDDPNTYHDNPQWKQCPISWQVWVQGNNNLPGTAARIVIGADETRDFLELLNKNGGLGKGVIQATEKTKWLGPVAVVAAAGLAKYEYDEDKISEERAWYEGTYPAIALGIGYAFGTGPGVVAGIGFQLGEMTYDAIYGLSRLAVQMNNYYTSSPFLDRLGSGY